MRSNGAAWGIDGERLAFGGSSSGASISLGAAVQLGGEGTAFLRAGVLLAGFFDTDADSESMRRFGKDTVPSQQSVRATLKQYLPDPALRADPRVNLVQADPRLLPPLFIAAAELDVLRDSSRRLAAMMKAAGRPHQWVEYQGMTHRFAGYSRTVETASRCIGDMAAFLAQNMR